MKETDGDEAEKKNTQEGVLIKLILQQYVVPQTVPKVKTVVLKMSILVNQVWDPGLIV